MPQIPQSQYYRFETRISQNDIAESWIAENSETGSKCFLKIEAQNPSLGQAAIRSTLTKSFECQADLKDPQVNTAISKRIEKGRLIIEYPFIDPDNWKTLTPGLFWEGFADILPQVCLIVDYLHLMGMVHCDLKLENFMVRFTNGGHKVILADLDFLRPDFSPLKGEIIGTPEYIAPEVMTNEVYTSQSDIYSLGMSFKNYSEQINDSNKFSANEIENFNNIITAMIDPDSVNRPSILLDVINNAGLIDKTRFDDLNRQLFKMQLASSWESALAEQALGLNQLQRFLLEKNLVFGIHDDLLDDFVSAYKINPTESLTLIAAFSNEIEILRFEDCWHIKISDQELLDYFGQIDRIKDKKDSLFQIDESIPEKQLRQFLDKADEEYNQSRYLRTYLILKFLTTNGLPKGNTDLKQNILEALIRNAVALNRSSETVEYLSHLMDRIPHDSDRYLELLFKLAFQYIKSGNLDAAHEKISQGIRDSEKLSDKIHKLDFQRLESWVLSARGEQDRALEILETIMQKANALKNDHLIIGTHNYLGSLYRRKGDFKKALESYQRSLKQAQNSELMNEAISSLTNLAMLSFEYAEYKQSIKYARLGLKSILGPEDIYTAPYLHTMLALSYARISEYDKAEYWNQRYLSHGLANYSNNTFGKFYLDHGWIKMARGQILHGRNYLTRAVHILELSSASSNLGKAYTSLGEIALFQGDSENCRKYLGKAREIFEKIGDSAALSDIKLIDNLNSHFNENDDDRQKLYQSMLELAACNSRYLAALALYYILIGEDRTIISRALDDIPDKIPYLKNEEAPLFRADILLSKMQKAGGDDFSQKAVILKSVYRTLHDSGQLYAALMACLRIARLYKDDSNFKLAGKFLKQAQNIAFRLKNRKQIKLIESELNSLPQGDAKKADSVELLHYVSDIIKDLKNYESTLEKLIQFAVDETGAERGVLLLRSDPQSELRSRAYINCDNESLKDIQDFSKSIPFHVSREQRPFIIDNAMTDSRTRGFKSIAIHNILSVICMPIFRNENVIGVIYLDHHTIPALFEEEDITLITSMANMISVVLSAAMEYRTVKTSRDQMITDMTKLGGSQNFVTQNQEMLEILKRIPTMASSDASVLIAGESGTGKEIICEMLHELSLRKSAPLIKMNCAAIPASLIEAELFGITRHAATGVDERVGKFQAADGGTLFLDEIGDMPLEIQSKVLRVLEYQVFEKVGSNRSISTDVHLIYATNRNLEKLVDRGEFRKDLFYRINALSIEIPPLRNRPEDIPLLIEHFIKIMATDKNNYPVISSPAMDLLIQYDWPGNVRQLKNLVEKFCILYSGKTIGTMDLPAEIQDISKSGGTKPRALEKAEKMQIRKLLIENDWNQSEVARLLNMPLSTLRRRIKKYKIKKI